MSKSKLTGYFGLVGSLAGILALLGGMLVFAFPTRVQLGTTEMRLQEKIAEGRKERAVHTEQIKRFDVRVTNLESRTERIDKNMVKLLERFRIRPAPMPAYKPVPSMPDSMTDQGDYNGD